MAPCRGVVLGPRSGRTKQREGCDSSLDGKPVKVLHLLCSHTILVQLVFWKWAVMFVLLVADSFQTIWYWRIFVFSRGRIAPFALRL